MLCVKSRRNIFLKSHEILFFSTYHTGIVATGADVRDVMFCARAHTKAQTYLICSYITTSTLSNHTRRVYPPINRNIRVRSYTSHSGYRQLPVRTCEMHHVASAAGMAFPAAVSPNAIQIPGRVRRPALPGRPRLGQEPFDRRHPLFLGEI